MKIDNLLVNKNVPITNASLKSAKADCINTYLPTLYDSFGNPINKGSDFDSVGYLPPISKVKYYATVAAGATLTTNIKVRSTARIVVLLSFESTFAGTGVIESTGNMLYINGVNRHCVFTGGYKSFPGKITMHISWSFIPLQSDVGNVLNIVVKGNSNSAMNHAVLEVRC